MIRHPRTLAAVPLLLAALLLAGCASADKNQTAAAASATPKSSTSGAKAGMNMNMGSSTVAAQLPAKIHGVPAPVAS